jgi:arginine:ornithine antiporter/lysine permease
MDKMNQDNKLSLVPLTALVLGSMVGSGLFALPQNMAATTGTGAMLIAWLITLVGMLVFQTLSMRKPQLDAGVYSYAKAGLGSYMGFNSAWGYWISAWMANVAYMIVLCSALSFFYPTFDDGTNIPSLILNSVMLWGLTFLCLKGIKSASIINFISTVAKIFPILVFIIVVCWFFNFSQFKHDFWGVVNLGSVLQQVKGAMLVTVWAFIGIEGASVFSSRAKNRKDIGRATIIGFMLTFFMLALVSALSYGVLSQSELTLLKNPSTAGVLYKVIGPVGSVLMNIGLIISVLGALLAWIMIAAEVPYVAAYKDMLFPKTFTATNKSDSPKNSLFISAVCAQIYLFVANFYHSGYLATISMAATMILMPYFFSAIYAFQLVITGESYSELEKNIRRKDFIISLIAVIYGVWLIYAAGIKYLLLSSILYAFGLVVYYFARKQAKERLFAKNESIIAVILILVGIFSIYVLCAGKISL